MELLDGNAVAAILRDCFGIEMTAVFATCAACGATAPVGEAVVYPRLPGTVIRCRYCTSLLMVVTWVRGVYCVDVRGIARLSASDAETEQAGLPLAGAALRVPPAGAALRARLGTDGPRCR